MVAVYRSGGRAGQILRFTWHFIQMFIAMGLGMAVLAVVVGLLGYQDLRERFPEGYAVLMTVAMVLPMAAWMRFGMRHGWARTTEMSAANSHGPGRECSDLPSWAVIYKLYMLYS